MTRAPRSAGIAVTRPRTCVATAMRRFSFAATLPLRIRRCSRLTGLTVQVSIPASAMAADVSLTVSACLRDPRPHLLWPGRRLSLLLASRWAAGAGLASIPLRLP